MSNQGVDVDSAALRL